MIKERELTKEIIESGVRIMRRRSIGEIIILFNDQTELEVPVIAHTLSVPKELRERYGKKRCILILLSFLISGTGSV